MEKLYPMPTEHSIRTAAKKCPEAETVLRELFPQAFIKFKAESEVGDIIEADCSKHRDSPKQTGTALGIVKVMHSPLRLSVGVEFFKSVGGHQLDGSATDGHGWWHNEGEVTLVFRPKKIKEK